jgi:hypothetical protein
MRTPDQMITAKSPIPVDGAGRAVWRSRFRRHHSKIGLSGRNIRFAPAISSRVREPAPAQLRGPTLSAANSA